MKAPEPLGIRHEDDTTPLGWLWMRDAVGEKRIPPGTQCIGRGLVVEDQAGRELQLPVGNCPHDPAELPVGVIAGWFRRHVPLPVLT